MAQVAEHMTAVLQGPWGLAAWALMLSSLMTPPRDLRRNSGLIVACPVNIPLIRMGVKKGMIDPHNTGHA
jgi:hypothetical protein